ncbi:hypothetical protein F4861DRAFT_532334 [Xylaria intraflava]|nr:hypothetical protein F4861DRAFT_532334 [Xylaria intraflava]
MPGGRPPSNIDEFRDEITDSYEAGVVIDLIYQSIVAQGCTSTRRTLERRIQAWNLQRQVHHTYTPEILARIQYLFYVRGWKDSSIQHDLAKSGFMVSTRTVKAVRLRHGMKRRYRTDEERDEALQQAADWLEHHARTSSAVRGFGKTYLYEFIRTQAGIVVGKNQIYQYYKTRWPEQVRQRSQANSYHHGRFVVPGRNFLWCFDGYMKLQKMGIEIYACIDAYSRMIIWIYVGPTACTALSTLKQFVRTISKAGVRPLFTRADMGVETALFAGAQGLLAQADGTAIAYDGPNGEEFIHQQGNLLSSCHIWGSSKQNQRIEAWWRVFRMGSTDRWVRYAEELSTTGFLNTHDERDLIAVYAIYGPMLRTEITEFVQLWNNHTIRRQKNRSYVVSGKPSEIYETSTVNWGIPIVEGSNADHLLRTMAAPLEDLEIDAFFPPETEEWCQTQLDDMGFDGILRTEEDHTHPHLHHYLELRRRVRVHRESGQAPYLSITPHPTGGYDQYMTLLEQNYPLLQHQYNLQGDPIPEHMLAGIDDYYTGNVEGGNANEGREV